MSDISALVGLTFVSIVRVHNDEVLHFVTDTGRKFKQFHDQGCCESVSIEDICGDLEDLIGSPIVRAEVRCSEAPSEYDSATYTFYELATNKGSVTIRWYGTSNGYYSETADFYEVFDRGEYYSIQ